MASNVIKNLLKLEKVKHIEIPSHPSQFASVAFSWVNMDA